MLERRLKIIKEGIKSFRKWINILDIKRKKVYLLIFMLVITTLLTSFRPLLFGHFIDVIETPQKAITIIVLIGMLDISTNILNYATQRIQFWLITDIEANAKKRIFQKILFIPYENFVRMEKGKFVNTLQKDAEVFSRILTLVVSLAVDIASTLSVAFIMIRINWKLTILFLVAFPINLFIFKKYGKKIKEKTKEGKGIVDKYLTFMNEILANMKTVKSFHAYNFAEEHFNKSIKRSYQVMDDRNRYNRKGSLIIQLINSCLDFIIILLGLNQIHRRMLTVGGLVSFQTYSTTLNRYLLRLSVVNSEIQEISISLERVENILKETEIVRDMKKQECSKEHFLKDIRLENLSFGYDNETKIFLNTNLRLEQKKIISIIGCNGTGKSTLLNLISVLYQNYEGNIYIGEIELREILDSSLRNYLCYVFQQNSLFSMSLRENILLGKEDVSDQEIQEVCQKVVLWDFVKSLPDGLDTVVGGNGISLSEGQKQKVIIARALLTNAKIYLLDEITANLDEESELQICKILLELKKKSLIINVSHRRKILEISDAVFEINKGEFLEKNKNMIEVN